jgi:hypothetical protein
MGNVVEGKLRVFAYPSKANPNNGHSENTGRYRNTIAATSPEYYFYQFDELPELIDFLVDLQNTETWVSKQTGKVMRHPVLETLEICGHGYPRKCDGLDQTTPEFDKFASDLGKVSWADDSSIYLTGCNTGCRIVQDEQGVAERLAELVPTKPKQFRCTVYGAVGYHTGTHAGGDGQADPDYVQNDIHYPNYFWQRQGHTKDSDPDPHMQSYRGFRGPNSA